MHSILGPPSIPAAPRRISGVGAGAATIAVAVRECDGLPWGFSGQPAPVPVKTRTRTYGHGFLRVRVTGL